MAKLPTLTSMLMSRNLRYVFNALYVKFQLLIEHTVHGENIDFTLTNVRANGALVDTKGHTIQSFSNPSRIGDIITIETLLQAAGVDLDSVSESPYANPGETLRSTGVVFLIFIEYKLLIFYFMLLIK